MVLKLKVNSTSIITFATKSDFFGMSTNAENISTVSSAVKTNADNITTLSNAVSTNCTDITTLSNAVSSNASSITTLSNAVSSHATELLSIHNNINSNAADILTVSNAVSSNASNITALSNAVSTKIDQANIATWGNLLAGRDEYYNEEGTEKDLSGHVISGEIGKGLLRGINSNASSIRSLQGDIDNIENLSYKDFKTYLGKFIDERVFGRCRLSVAVSAVNRTSITGQYFTGLSHSYNGDYRVTYTTGAGGIKSNVLTTDRIDKFYAVGGFSSLTRHDWNETAVDIPQSPFLLSPYINIGMYTGRSWRVLKDSLMYNKPFFSQSEYLLNIPEIGDDNTTIINRSIEISTKGVRALNGSITLGDKLLTDSYQAFNADTYMLKFNDLSIGTITYQKLANLPPYKMDIAIDYDTGRSCLLVDEPEEVYIDIASVGESYTIYGFSLNNPCQLLSILNGTSNWNNVPVRDTLPSEDVVSSVPSIVYSPYNSDVYCIAQGEQLCLSVHTNPQYTWGSFHAPVWHNFYTYKRKIGWEWKGALGVGYREISNQFFWSKGYELDLTSKYLGYITIKKEQGRMYIVSDKNNTFVLPEITNVAGASYPNGLPVTTNNTIFAVGTVSAANCSLVKVVDSARRGGYIYLHTSVGYSSITHRIYLSHGSLCVCYTVADRLGSEK